MAGSGVVLGYLKYVLGFDSLAFEKGLGDADKRLKSAQRSLQKTADKFTSIGKTLSLGVTLPLAAFATSAFKASSDAAELQSAFDQTFGSMSATMTKWAEDTGDALGRSTQEMQKAANTFGIFFNTAVDPAKAAAMSQTFAKLAQDLGSFYNVDTETAIEKLRSGLSGESEPLRDFGVFLTEASVKAKALELGLTGVGNELTEQEKIAARYALIMEQTSNAQGDVERTSGGTANQLRRAQAAFEELQVVIGTKLLPVLTPLITKIADGITWFTQLPAPIQNAAVAVGALAAAVGPVAYGFGTLMSVLAPVLARMTIAAGAAGLPALTAVLGPLAVAAAAVVIAWKNWDKIGPWIDGVVARTREAGGKIDGFFKGINDWAERTDRRLGIPPKNDMLKGIGDWAVRTWNKVNEYDLQRWADGVDAAILRMANSAVASMQRLYQGVKTWIGDKLNAVWDGAKKKIDAVGGWFYDLYDKVVGHSYIPDMVDRIGDHMGRLQGNMVGVAQSATAATAAAFAKLEDDVRPIMERLFPERAAAAQYAGDLATIQGSKQLSDADKREAARRLGLSNLNTQNGLSAAIGAFGGIAAIGEPAKQLGEEVAGAWTKIEGANDNLRNSFLETTKSVTSALRGLVENIRSGDWLSALTSVADLFIGLGASGLFGKKVQTNIGSFGGFRANGGPVSAGRTYMVGERGPELFTARRSGYVHANGSGGGARAPVVFDLRGAVMTEDLLAQVNAQTLATGGVLIQDNNRRMAKKAQRRLAR